jgi:hypothetical protein
MSTQEVKKPLDGGLSIQHGMISDRTASMPGLHEDGLRSRLSILRTTGAQRPYKPVNVALARVWKCRSNPTSAAEAESFLASGSLSTSTAKTVIW